MIEGKTEIERFLLEHPISQIKETKEREEREKKEKESRAAYRPHVKTAEELIKEIDDINKRAEQREKNRPHRYYFD